ncbi:MAG: hypothetical protein CMH51_04500 [Myxococcales bacterium]|nr:hypothetical protein [Myxococcales bacterium]
MRTLVESLPESWFGSNRAKIVIDHSLLDILVCPETKQGLRVVESAVLEALNASIASGSVRNRGGGAVTAAVSEALIRADGEVLYPVRDDIPIMLIDESISLPTQA